jgi:hypothetical protein
MLKLFMLISTTLIAFIIIALLMKGSSFSQVILGSLYYFPVVIFLKLGVTGVTTSGCSLFGSCIATPLGWALITLFWTAIILIVSSLLSFAIKHIKSARE